MAVGAVIARILTQYSDKGSKAARKDIEKLGNQFDDFAKKTTRAFGLAAAAVGAFAIKVGKDAVQAAIADQKSQALLANSLRNTVGATDNAIATVEDYISKLQLQVKVADDELRPSLAKLAAVTGSVAAAQELLGLALDVSAFSGSDLGSATNAVTKALQGNFKTLQKLVPGLSTATIKSKDFAAIINEVTRITQGSAATRAGTLEYRLQGLRIAYGEIIETLGYALLPIIEKFADTIQRDVLPQVEKWVNANKKGLAEGFKQAAEAALELLKAAIKFGQWVVANFETIKNLAVLIATMWATGKIYNFVSAIGKVTLAFKGMRDAAALAAVASAAATGASAGGTAGILSKFAPFLAGSKALGVAALPLTAIATAAYFVKKEGNKIRANRAKVEAGLVGYKGAPGPSDLAALTGTKKSKVKVDKSMQAYLDYLNKMNKIETKAAKPKKELTKRQEHYNKLLKDMGITTTEQQDAITQFAIRANLLKQAAITGSPLTSIGSPTPMNMAYAGMNNPINVYVQGSVISERDLATVISQSQQKKTTAGAPIGNKYLGGGGGTGLRFQTQVI
jgi:hypothetical protein